MVEPAGTEHAVGPLIDLQSGRQWRADEAARAISHRAADLSAQGVSRGERVLLCRDNSAAFFIDLLALWRVGACAVMIDPRLAASEIVRLGMAARSARAIVATSMAGALNALAGAQVSALHDASEPNPQRDGSIAAPPADGDALILFTSGTTGEPKGVVHTHRTLQARWRAQRQALGVAAFERTLCAVPVNFAWGLVGNALYAWLNRQTLVIAPAFRNDVALRLGALCDEHRITYLPLVPSMWKLVIRMAPPPQAGTLRRVASGTAALPISLWKDIARWSGTRDVLNVYGITECGWIAGASLAEPDPADGSVGTPWGCTVRIVTSGDTAPAGPQALPAAAPGQVGHVWVRTESLMRGYFERPAATAEVVAGQWFRTGDLGTVDPVSGALRIVGRDKDMISVGGIKVYPEDVDLVLLRHPAVEDCCAFAMEDALHGESVATAVVLKAEHGNALSAVYGWAEQHLARHQLPRRWYLLGQITRSARGKLIRSEIAKACAGSAHVEQAALARQLRGGTSAAAA